MFRSALFFAFRLRASLFRAPTAPTVPLRSASGTWSPAHPCGCAPSLASFRPSNGRPGDVRIRRAPVLFGICLCLDIYLFFLDFVRPLRFCRTFPHRIVALPCAFGSLRLFLCVVPAVYHPPQSKGQVSATASKGQIRDSLPKVSNPLPK